MVSGTARPPPSFVPIIARARRKEAQTRRKGGGGAEPDRTGQDTTRPDSDRGARRPRPELQSRLTVVMLGLA